MRSLWLISGPFSGTGEICSVKWKAGDCAVVNLSGSCYSSHLLILYALQHHSNHIAELKHFPISSNFNLLWKFNQRAGCSDCKKKRKGKGTEKLGEKSKDTFRLYNNLGARLQRQRRKPRGDCPGGGLDFF